MKEDASKKQLENFLKKNESDPLIIMILFIGPVQPVL